MTSPVPYIFEQKAVENFRRRASRVMAKKEKPHRFCSCFLLQDAAESLRERLTMTRRSFASALDIYSHTDLAADILRESGKVAATERIESLPECAESAYPMRICTAENLVLPSAQTELITSLLSLHMVNDIPGLLLRIRQALKPDGLFLAALCGAGTLGELRASLLQAEMELYGGATPHIAPFMDVREAGNLLQRAGFALPVADIETVTVRYPHMFALMQDLRCFGAQNALADRRRLPLSRRFFLRAAEIYAENFADAGGRIRATFSVIWLSGWSPHKSQQQPLPPGSAQISLAKILDKADIE